MPAVGSSRNSTRGSSVRSEQAVDLPAGHGEADLVQGAELAEVARHPAHVDAGAGGLVQGRGFAHGAILSSAAMPGLSSGAGSISTFTPKTCSERWSRV